MARGHNEATRMLSVVRNVVNQNTKSGANIEQTYGQVFGISSDATEASVYLAGSRELAESDGGVPEPSDGFRIPSWMYLNAGDYVRVSIDGRGHRWVEEYINTSPYSKVSIDYKNGRLAFGDGTGPPTNFLSLSGGPFTAESLNINDSLEIDDVGLIRWGPGNGTWDVLLFRPSTGVLETDGVWKTSKFHRHGANSFPASPTTNDLFYRKDLSMWCLWDGSDWVTAQKFTKVLPYYTALPPYSATAADALRAPMSIAGGMSAAKVLHHSVTFLVASGGTALSASHKWVVTLKAFDSSGSVAVGSGFSIDSGASNQWRSGIETIGVTLSDTHAMVTASMTKTGTPGNLHVLDEITYRFLVL